MKSGVYEHTPAGGESLCRGGLFLSLTLTSGCDSFAIGAGAAG